VDGSDIPPNIATGTPRLSLKRGELVLLISDLGGGYICALQSSIEGERTFVMGLEVRGRMGIVRLSNLELLAPIDLVFTPRTEILRLCLPIMPWTTGGIFAGPHTYAKYVLQGKK
jgi:hypothetical protein